jgi:hypothetical protein
MAILLFKVMPLLKFCSTDESSRHHQLKTWYQISLLFIAVLGTYYYIIVHGDFIALDDMNLMSHLLNDRSLSLKSIFFPQNFGNYYRPLLELSYRIDHFIWFDVASGWHLTNVILHGLNTVLVFLISRILLADTIKETSLAAFYSALIYAINPLSTEAVCWVSARSELLAAFFMLFSFYLYLQFKVKGSYVILLSSGLLFLFAVTAKETALSLPALIIAYEIIFRQPLVDKAQKAFFTVGFFLCLFVCYFLFLRPGAKINLSLMHIGLGSSGLQHVSHFENVEVLFASFGFYVKKMLIPYPLNFAIHSINLIFYSLFGILVLILSAVLVRSADSVYRFIVLWVLLTIFPAVAAAVLRLPWVLWAERYLYVPLAGFSMALVLGFILAIRHRRIAMFPVMCLIVLLWLTSLHRVYLWADEVRLWEDTAKHSKFGMVNFYYGKALLVNNQESAGIEQLKMAIARKYSYDPYLTLSDFEINKGDYRESEFWLQKAACDFPKNIEVHKRLAENYLWRTTGGAENDEFLMKAIEEYKKYLTVQQEDAATYLKIAQLYRVAHQEQRAVPFLERVIKIDSGSPLAHTAMRYLQEKRKSENLP